ncbi:MAG: S1 family peptidase [Candidatus Omnitrophota bacterium]
MVSSLHSIIRIRNENEQIVGSGFLISETQLVTCSHVVKEALNISKSKQQIEAPQGNIKLDFPFLSPQKILTAKIFKWSPTLRDSNNGMDIAILEINECPPRDSRPVSLFLEEDGEFKENEFKVYGFPNGYDAGLWSTGKVVGMISNGLIQLEDPKTTGKPIDYGYSGGPVYDKKIEKVIGIIALADKISGTKISFMIPAQKIRDLDPSFTPIESIDIPVVIAAMTKKEATFLFKNINGNGSFLELHKILSYFDETDVKEWISNYGESRDDWRPHIYSENKLCNLIWELAININECCRKGKRKKPIYPKFVSNNFFDDKDKNKQYEIWREIIDSGGIVITDAISLFHPNIQKMLSRSEISSHETVSVLGINPLNKAMIEANKIIEGGIRSYMQHSFIKYETNFEKSCEFGVNNLKNVERWLYELLQKTAKTADEYRSNPNNCAKFRRMVGKSPNGLLTAIKGDFL